MFKVSYRDVYTLNPSNLLKLGQDWIDLSSVSNPTIRIFSSTSTDAHSSTPVQLPYAMKQQLRKTTRQRWPAHSKGFLYYHSPPSRPPIAGELRLRLTPSNHASTFSQGKDLTLLLDNPWKRPLYSIAKTTSMRPLYEKLLQENLITRSLARSLDSLPKLNVMYSRCQIVHSLYDPFTLDLSSNWITLVAISDNGIATIQLLRQFRDARLRQPPYSGSVLATFEPSPFSEHINTRTVVLRILQELTPVQSLVQSYDEYIERPTPGHLFAKRFHGKLRPWTVDLDRPDKGKLTTDGLNLIWRSTPGLGHKRL